MTPRRTYLAASDDFLERQPLRATIGGEMPAPQRLPAPVLPEHQRFYEAVARLGRKGLRRYGLSDADGDEVIACYLIAAYQRWPTYQAEKGTPAQWLLGILRNEVRVFLRKRGRYAEGDQIRGEQSDTLTLDPPTPLVKQLMAKLSPIEQRIVSMHEIEGYSFDEIAFLENKSKTQVHRIHAGAMEKMRSEASTHAFPVLIAASAASRALEPTAEQSARFWQGFLAKHGGEVGIPAPEDDDPPESGVCRPGPSSRPPAGRSPKQRAFRALSVIGPLAGLLLAVPVADATRRTHDREPVLAANLAPMPAAGPMAVAGMAISSAATANAAGSAGATNSMVVVVSAAPGSTPTAPRTLRGYDDRGDPDRALRDQWREAAAIGNWTRACVALEKHARLYPRGQSAAARDQLRNAVCGAPRANSTRLQ